MPALARLLLVRNGAGFPNRWGELQSQVGLILHDLRLSLAKYKSAFGITNIRRGRFTCYMDNVQTARRFGEEQRCDWFAKDFACLAQHRVYREAARYKNSARAHLVSDSITSLTRLEVGTLSSTRSGAAGSGPPTAGRSCFRGRGTVGTTLAALCSQHVSEELLRTPS